MAIRVHKYEVEGRPMGTCGRFSMITAKNLKYPDDGFDCLICDRGYKKGDIIEEHDNPSIGYKTILVKKNGEIIYQHDEEKEAREAR